MERILHCLESKNDGAKNYYESYVIKTNPTNTKR